MVFGSSCYNSFHVFPLLYQYEEWEQQRHHDIDSCLKFLKEGAPVLASPITDLVNLSISLSLFPDDCKIAKLKPLYKKEAKTKPKNYQPISLLSLLSKIIERIIHNQTQEFLDKNNILYKYNLDFGSITPQTLVCLTLLIKLKLALRKDYSQVWF